MALWEIEANCERALVDGGKGKVLPCSMEAWAQKGYCLFAFLFSVTVVNIQDPLFFVSLDVFKDPCTHPSDPG